MVKKNWWPKLMFKKDISALKVYFAFQKKRQKQATTGHTIHTCTQDFLLFIYFGWVCLFVCLGEEVYLRHHFMYTRDHHSTERTRQNFH